MNKVSKLFLIAAAGLFFVGCYNDYRNPKAWGIGFRVEDNCLVTEGGCENLSAMTPRTIDAIEDTMRQNFVAF